MNEDFDFTSDVDNDTILKVGEEKEIGKQGLTKKLLDEGEGCDTLDVGDEVQDVPSNLLEYRIPILIGDNYADWKEHILLTLGCMELDLALRVDEPPIPLEGSAQEEKDNYKRWERSNRLSLKLIKSHISKSIRGSIPNCDKVKAYMKAVEEKFVSSNKSLASTLLKKLLSMKHDKSRGVHEHIMEMRDTAAKLNSLEVEISESFLVHFILNSLPMEYNPFKISYNTCKDEWSINKLLTMCVQEEERLMHEPSESAHVMIRGKENGTRGNGFSGVH